MEPMTLGNGGGLDSIDPKDEMDCWMPARLENLAIFSRPDYDGSMHPNPAWLANAGCPTSSNSTQLDMTAVDVLAALSGNFVSSGGQLLRNSLH
jgi:hypothetical protein